MASTARDTRATTHSDGVYVHAFGAGIDRFDLLSMDGAGALGEIGATAAATAGPTRSRRLTRAGGTPPRHAGGGEIQQVAPGPRAVATRGVLSHTTKPLRGDRDGEGESQGEGRNQGEGAGTELTDLVFVFVLAAALAGLALVLTLGGCSAGASPAKTVITPGTASSSITTTEDRGGSLTIRVPQAPATAPAPTSTPTREPRVIVRVVPVPG